MKNPVAWFEIYVEDMGHAKAFYESVFGIQLAKLESPGLESGHFPWSPIPKALQDLWPKCRVFLPEKIASLSISAAPIVPWKQPRLRSPAAGF